MRIIAGESKGRKLRTVKRSGTRPTMERVRESLLAILAPWIRGARFLDLFAGTGSVGLEALSRGAAFAAFVDSNHGCASAIRENLALMGCSDQALVIARPWTAGLKVLAERGQPFQVIFADPPYEEEAVLERVAERVLQYNLLPREGWLIFQHTIHIQLPGQLNDEVAAVDFRRFGDTALTFYRRGRASGIVGSGLTQG